MNFTDSSIDEYSKSFTTPEPEILRELTVRSEKELEYTDMLSGRRVGMLLSMFVKISGCTRILEIGTFTGYSAIAMADAMPENGELITLEMNDRYRAISEPFFKREPYRQKIRQIMGNALETI